MSFFDEIKTEIQTEQNQKSNLAEQASPVQEYAQELLR